MDKTQFRRVKVNYDEAFSKSIQGKVEVGIGIVIRDEDGKVVAGTSRKVYVKTCLETKAKAVQEGMRLVERGMVSKG